MKRETMKKIKKDLKKVWWFIWESNSVWSWIVNIVLAFIIIKFLIYPALGFALGTSYPVVAVVSGSMEHKAVPICLEQENGKCIGYKPGKYVICGTEIDKKGKVSFDEFFSICGDWYLNKTDITKEDFSDFKFKNGFNKGDIMVLAKSENVKLGDIIVFDVEHRKDPIIHRVVALNGNGYTTKGDHNKDSGAFEKKVPKEKIIGKAVMRIPLLGWIKVGLINLLRLIGVGG